MKKKYRENHHYYIVTYSEKVPKNVTAFCDIVGQSELKHGKNIY